MTNVVVFPRWKKPLPPVGGKINAEELQFAARWALKEIADKETGSAVLSQLGQEYMYEPKGLVWYVWQALAYNERTPEHVLRELYPKNEWFITIALVHNASTPAEIIESIAHLPVEIRGANEVSKGYDKNKEIRDIARKRLGLPEFKNGSTAK